MNAFSLLEQLSAEHTLDASQWEALIAANSPELAARAAEMACAVRHEIYGNRVFIRGLIEFTSYCPMTVIIAGCAGATGTPSATA